MPNGHDKNWVRLCAAIDGFRVRYGRWPIRVRISGALLADIRDHLFTRDDYARILAKLSLIEDESPKVIEIVAEDDSGGRYRYGEGFPVRGRSPGASEWLGVRPRSEKP